MSNERNPNIASENLEHYYKSEKEVKDDLRRAMSNPNLSLRAGIFLDTLKDNLEKYGMKTIMSEKQYEWFVDLVNHKKN